MIKTGKGHIVTVGSLTGLLGTYKCTDYSASKFATIGFHESLLIELKVSTVIITLPLLLLLLFIDSWSSRYQNDPNLSIFHKHRDVRWLQA